MRVRLSNHQKEIRLRVRPLQRQLETSLAFLPRPLPGHLVRIDFILIDRAAMRKAHHDFLGDATETDVITFPYGEILICPAVARDQAAEHGLKTEEEILLYGLHGLLHLAGYDDRAPADSKKMAAAQHGMLREVLELEKPPA